MKTVGFIAPITSLILRFLSTDYKHNIIPNSIELCEYNIDCALPKVCCKNSIFSYCCIRNDLKLQPIVIRK